MEKKKIVVFSGAGLDQESGIETFRGKSGYWTDNYKIDEVATPQGWKKDPAKVLDFYNQRRRELPNALPNKAHTDLVRLEEHFEVTHVTQNISDLLERALASKVFHLHGELTKARGSYGMGGPLSDYCEPFDIGYKDINIGDLCPEMQSQIRPHICWFSEMPFYVKESYKAIKEADILIIIGTSLEILYTHQIIASLGKEKKCYYIDPNPPNYLDKFGMNIEYIKLNAIEGVNKIVNELLFQAIEVNKTDELWDWLESNDYLSDSREILEEEFNDRKK